MSVHCDWCGDDHDRHWTWPICDRGKRICGNCIGDYLEQQEQRIAGLLDDVNNVCQAANTLCQRLARLNLAASEETAWLSAMSYGSEVTALQDAIDDALQIPEEER